MASVQKITPNLWFETNAEEAVDFYTSVFPDGRIGTVTRYGAVGQEIHGMPEGAVLTIEFEVGGMQFLALNGGPVFKFTEAISFIIDCADQAEVDYFWERLTEGGDPAAQQCGWLKDKFGLSWQVVPSRLNELMSDPDQAVRDRVMATFLPMKKIVIAELESAARGDS